MLFSQRLTAPNIRMLASTSTVRQNAAGSCPEICSQKEACLQARFPLAELLWPSERSSIVSKDVPSIPLTAPGDAGIAACSLHLASHELLTNKYSEDIRKSMCRQCGTGKYPRVSSPHRRKFPREIAFNEVLGFGS